MTPDQLANLHDAVFRNTGQDPMWLGYWLKHFVESENIAWPDLAQDLGTSAENLVLLCLCRTPRADHFQDDLNVVCQRVGAKQELVARILRQEQAMLRWRENTRSTTPGWLVAASDQEDPAANQDPEIDDDEA